ncbi:MAG: leucyl aminopeptidase [Deltaproteobacteria bacterium]|nr:leucyl aminopeptidase [Deltaproteobacteria bacterium]
MKILIKKPSPDLKAESLVVLPLISAELEKPAKKSKAGTGLLSRLDAMSGGKLAERLRRAKFKAKAGQTFVLNAIHENLPATLVLVGWEAERASEFETISRYRRLGSIAADVAKRSNAPEIAIVDAHLNLKAESNLAALVEGLLLTGYTFTHHKSKKDDSPFELQEVRIHSSQSVSSKSIDAARRACEATLFARDLINTSPRECTPTFLANHCRKIAKAQHLKIDVFDPKALKKMGAGGILAVSQGSSEPAYLIRMVYTPKKKTKKNLAIVGKGVTFDSGGLSIKTAGGMETMKCDMSGAAAVMAVMSVVADLRPDFEVRAYIPTTENMINGQATRPGDVITAMSGKTIEVLNTDAEGRLILADALNLAEKDGCGTIIDLATLTGACMVALGTSYAGLFCNDDKLADLLVDAGDRAGELLWRMPLAKEYKDWIKSHVADIKNTGRAYGGAITAALFLEEFISKARWAHLDIAGPAFADGDSEHVRKGGVGFGVRTLLNLISEY